jgi:hypothetical protein
MNIEFTERVIPTDNGGMMFQALVDGKSVVCRISPEALQQHFGGSDDLSETQVSNLQAFQRGRARINEVAARMIRAGLPHITVDAEDIV